MKYQIIIWPRSPESPKHRRLMRKLRKMILSAQEQAVNTAAQRQEGL